MIILATIIQDKYINAIAIEIKTIKSISFLAYELPEGDGERKLTFTF